MKTDTIKHYFSRRLFVRATHIIGICLFLLAGVMPLSAQVYSTSQYGARYDARQNMQYGEQYNGYGTQEEMQPTYNPYQSTVYQPFGSSMPSGSNPSYISSSSSNMGTYNPITGRRNTASTGGEDPTNPSILETGGEDDPTGGNVDTDDFDHPSDPGNQSDEFPVGEPWVMLFFAAAAAVVVFVRQRKAAVRG